MKKITIKLLFLISFLFISSFAFSQDRVYLINGEVIEVEIASINNNELVYYTIKDGTEVRHVIPTNKLIRVVKADGRTIAFKESYKDASFYTGQLKQSLKFHMFSPLLGHTGFSYEKSLSPGRSLEYTAGIIGLGNNFELGWVYEGGGNYSRDVDVAPLGAYLGIGLKIYSKPVVRSTGWRYRHLLQGWYVMPKLLMGHYKENYILRENNIPFESVKRRSVTFLGLMAYAGKQVIFSGTYLLEWHVGLGFGGDNLEESTSYHYITTIGANSVMIGGGLRLGILF